MNIKYNHKLSVEKNAQINGCSVSSIRKYILLNSIDRRHDKKMGFSVIYAFLIYLAGLVLAFIIIFVISLFNNTIYTNLFASPEFIEFWVLKMLMILMIFIYICCNIAVYFISNKLLKKGIDVD